MKRNSFALAALLASLLAVPAFAAVTTTTEIEAVAMAHDAFVLTPAAPAVTRPLVVDATPTAVVRVSAISRTLAVSLIAPNGTRLSVGAAETPGFLSGRIDNPNVPDGATYAMVLRQPQSGTYTLDVRETAPLAGPRNVVVTTLFENSTRAMIIGGGDSYPAGGDIRLAAVALDALGKVRNLTVTARLIRRGDATFTPVPVAFRDDGFGADLTAGDAVYSAFVNPGGAGAYEVHATIDGMAASGAFRRTANADFMVVPRRAVMDGSFVERAIDSNGDGLINTLAIAPRANLTEAGSYDVQVRLRASNGNFLQRTRRVTLAAGNVAPEVLFEAEEITRDLAVDGPWAVELARYDRVLGTDVVTADVRYSLGPTAAYLLSRFQRPRLRVVGATSVGVDTNGNGLFDRLDVRLNVAVDFAGSYTFSAGLRDRNGADLGFRTGNAFLTAGLRTIVLSYDGHAIGGNGVDGPYSLSSFLLFGAGHSVVGTSFTTAAHRASEFEGFARDVTPPTLSVTVTPNVLWPANHQMIEIVPAISVHDDFDPSPVVTLVSITSNEGDDVRGDGNTSDDIVIDGSRIFLRAERSGLGEGRVYTLTWQATDQTGNSSLASATVSVPHDQNKK